jgi:hypothetical protein
MPYQRGPHIVEITDKSLEALRRLREVVRNSRMKRRNDGRQYRVRIGGRYRPSSAWITKHRCQPSSWYRRARFQM